MAVVLDRAGAMVGHNDDSSTIVWLRGEQDASTRPELARLLAGAIASGTNHVVVDLSDVQFLDGSTIGLLIAAHEFLRARSRSLGLRSPSKFVHRVLDICGVSDLVERHGASAGIHDAAEQPFSSSGRQRPFEGADHLSGLRRW